MTDSMNFGPEWLRNLSSDGSTSGGGSRPQLADYRYGREEMLTLFTKGLRPPTSLINFPMLYANTAQGQLPLALTPVTDDERSSGSLCGWSSSGGGSIRGNMTGGAGLSTGTRGGGRSISLVGTGRGGLVGRGGIRGGSSGGGGGWITTNHNGSNMDATEWSPRKEYMSGGGGGGSYRSQSLVTDNWRKGARSEAGGIDGDGGNLCGSAQQGQDGWRQGQQIRSGERSASSSTSEQPPTQRWIQRSTSWRDGDPSSNGGGPTTSRGPQQRRVWDEDNNHHQQQLPEWALEQVSEPGGGTPVAGSFDATGAFHGELHKSTSQQNIGTSTDKVGLPLATSRSALSLVKSETGQCGVNNRSYVPSLSKLNKEQPIDSTNDKRQSDDAKSKENNRANVKENVLQQQQHIDKGKSVQQLINGSLNGVALNKTDILENSNVDRGMDRDDEDFDRLQEDLVLKLVVDEEPSTNNGLGVARGDVGIGVVNHAQPPPPPNLLPPQADKWFYQDPQGDLQGPFMARDMAEWYGAGYFSVALLVRRGCDERFFRLGDLVALCQGGNPFQVRPRIQPPPLLLLDNREQLQEIEQRKATGPSVVGVVNGPVTQGPSAGPAPMLPDHPDLLQLQILQQQIAYRQHSAAQHQAHQQQFNNQTAPVQVQPNHRNSIVETSPASWASSMQQRDLLTQQLLQQQQQHIHQQTQPQPQHQVPPSNPLMHMISQMQQQQGVTKSGLIDQQQVPVQSIAAPLQQQPSTQPPPIHAPSTTQPFNPLEALIAQMGNLQSPVTKTSPLHSTDHSQSHPAAHQQQTPTSTPSQSNPLLELIRMKQQQRVVPPMQQVQQQQPAATQLEQLAMWQKNHHLQQHIQHQHQQWRVLQQQGQQVQGMHQEQSVGLWDISNPTTTLPHQSTTIASVINDQHSLSHHSSPSPPTQQQQQIIPTPQMQQPSVLTTDPQDTQAYAPLSVPQVQEEAGSTPGKKKKAAASDSLLVEKKKDEERQKKKELTKKQDSEKKQQSSSDVDEKQRKKEEEKAGRIKEEKAKQRESDERKAKENEQKRKAKEQRKIDEENKRKTEEQKRLDDIDKERQAARERGSENLRRLQQAHEAVEPPSQSPPPSSKVHSASPAVPWQLSTSITSSANHSKPAFQGGNLSPPVATNLVDIQRAEREKRTLEQQQQLAAIAATAALYQQQQQLLQLEREHQENSKTFSWASKPLKVEKVKSLAEIQAEEHELLFKKQAEEQRLAAIKEKEAAAVPTAGIWSGQSLTWASENISSYNIGGFWDETPRSQKQVQSAGQQQVSDRMPSGANSQQMAKQLSSIGKSLPGNVIGIAKKQQQTQQSQAKNMGAGKNNNNNNDSTDEFRNWCSKMLANMNANVDVPTFIGFLRDIESAFDVREYCRDYLGDSGATQQFAAQFLEKRRLFKPNRSVAHKDDMCAPAPALTPNHHAGGVATGITTIAATITTSASYATGLREPSGNNVISMDFQEVKVKGKKVKKSKMLKVDSRILGFSVTAAPDRFNVGDRDYGDTT